MTRIHWFTTVIDGAVAHAKLLNDGNFLVLVGDDKRVLSPSDMAVPIRASYLKLSDFATVQLDFRAAQLN